MNATLQVKRDNLRMILQFRDPSSGQLVVTAEIDWTSVGEAIAKGGLDFYPANALLTIHEQRTDKPTLTEKRTHLIQCPALPDQKLYPEDHARALADVLRPYEIDGWKAMPGQLGDRSRVKRALPGGVECFEVDFVRHTYAPASEPAVVPS